jgi:hypothetical protein
VVNVFQALTDLKREQFKVLALNTMINIAERELKVDIRKKAGAKR